MFTYLEKGSDFGWSFFLSALEPKISFWSAVVAERVSTSDASVIKTSKPFLSDYKSIRFYAKFIERTYGAN